MPALTNPTQIALLDHVSAVAPFTAPTQLDARLHTGDPGATGAANQAAHTTLVTAVALTAAAGDPAANSNSATLTWANLTADETIAWVVLIDQGGTPRLKAQLTTPRAVLIGDDLIIDPGELDFTLN